MFHFAEIWPDLFRSPLKMREDAQMGIRRWNRLGVGSEVEVNDFAASVGGFVQGAQTCMGAW